MTITRRGALGLGLAGLCATLGGEGGSMHRRPGVAFGTTVSVAVEAEDPEPAFKAAFEEIRLADRLASLTRPGGEVFRLNRDGFLDMPSAALLEMLETAALMHKATAGAFDVTIQPLWLAMDAAAKRGRWLDEAELADARARVDQSALRFDARRVVFEKPGMAITLNSLARGLAADRVGAALRNCGIERAIFDTDVLGGAGRRRDGREWLARIRHPRRAQDSVAVAPIAEYLATSGDYQYAWSPDYARHHIVDPRLGRSPGDFASVTVRAPTGLMADALSTAAFLVGAEAAPALLARFGAQAFFVGKEGQLWRTSGFAIAALPVPS